MKNKKKLTTSLLSAFIAFVFIQSLFFKFTGAAETQHIFSVIDSWAADSLGLSGLFLPPGIFNAYVIGTAELIASIMLISALFLKKDALTGMGALLSLGIISGAIFFHLCTPLGINVQGDGGTLFYMACGVWISSLILITLHKKPLLSLIHKP